MNDTPHSVLSFARRFFFGTILSRFGGFLRDVTMAFCFGSTPEVASFMVAYRLANLFRRLLGEGNAQAGFIPAFELLKKENPKSAFLFYRDAVWSMGWVLLFAVVLLEGSLYFVRPFLGSEWQTIATLAMWMVPALFFICLFSLQAALLQSQKKSFWVGACPALFNVGWIVAALISSQSRDPMPLLALGVTAAFGLQWAFASLQVRRETRMELVPSDWLTPRLFNASTRSLFKPMALGVLGVGATQINSALDAIFAKLSDPSGPAYLWYAIRIEQLPLALFGIALSGALLPPLARAIARESDDTYQALLRGAIRYSLALMIPCTFGLLILGEPGLNLLYGHGDFTPRDVETTSTCLWAYGLGLIPSSLVLLLAQGFYAKKSYRIPTSASLSAVAANVGLNALFVFGFGWGAVSIALATSASAWINLAILLGSLGKREFFLGSFLFRITGASGLAAGVSLGLQTLWITPLSRGVISQLVEFGVPALVYLAGLMIFSRIFKISEISEIIKRRIAPE